MLHSYVCYTLDKRVKMNFIKGMQMSPEAAFMAYVKKNDLSMTLQRKVIVETFLETEGHFSAEDLFDLVKAKVPDIGQATVYRTLKLLVDSGLADRIELEGTLALYEHAYGHNHHDHLICMECGTKVEVFDQAIEERQEELAATHGFNLTRHRMYLYGLCPKCQPAGK